MLERDRQIIELTVNGLAAPKIVKRLNLRLSIRSVQRIQHKYLGPKNPLKLNNSAAYQVTPQMRPYVEECFRRLGKDPYFCENCKEQQIKRCEWHHTKYEGCTIYDLQLVCLSCNRARENVGLH